MQAPWRGRRQNDWDGRHAIPALVGAVIRYLFKRVVAAFLSLHPGAALAPVLTDFDRLSRKHANQFPTIGNIRACVEQALADPTHVLPGSESGTS